MPAALTFWRLWCVLFAICARFTLPAIATTGMFSSLAVTNPVTRLLVPGPDVTMQTPGLPVILPMAAAMKAAFCSWRVTTNLISGWSRSALKTESIFAPGTPKTYLTPAATSESMTIWTVSVDISAGAVEGLLRG